MAPGTRNKFGAPIFKPKVSVQFRLYSECHDWSAATISACYGQVASTVFQVLAMTQPGIEPSLYSWLSTRHLRCFGNKFTVPNLPYESTCDIVGTFQRPSMSRHPEYFSPFTLLRYALICTCIADIFNHCVQNGVFPDKLKLTKVILFFNSSAKDVASNYRSISILPHFSKTSEKLIPEN